MPTLRKPLLVLLLWGTAVGGSFAQLSANFTNQIACDRSVTFTNHSSGFTTVSWNFGDGNTSSSINPTHQYAASGTFNVQLSVSNGTFSTSFSQGITVYDPPSQTITGSLSVCEDAQEIYSVSSSGNNYQWSVTGGTITGGQGTNTITVQWIQNGTGIVTLMEQNASGCTSNINATVSVHSPPNPVIDITAVPQGTVNQSSSACLYSTEVYQLEPPLNAGSTYQWSVTGGNIAGTASADSVVVYWNVEGGGLLEVTETNIFGCSATSQAIVQVLPIPTASFRTIDICLGNTANFTDLSTGDFTDWYWEFGDGATSSFQNPSHVYTAAGTYHVKLTISSVPDSSFYRSGCSDDTIIAINVDQNPGPEITCPGTVCAGDAETYSTPAIAGATYTWAVTGGTITGGGGTSDNDITITWGNGPVGTISLLVTGAGTYCNLPTVIEIPIISPHPQITGPTTVCLYNYATYQAPVLPGSVYTWTVTGGTLAQGQGTSSIETYFYSTGTKTISLDVFNDLTECGGQDVLTVQALDQFYLSASPSVCAQSIQTYTVSGTPATSGYAWNWTATGGTITAGQGTNSITVQWGNGPVGEIAVNAPAGIYCNAQEKLALNVKPLPPPAALNGAMNVCATSTNTYYVAAGLYTSWTVTGGTVTSGGTAGSNYATVTWGSGSTGQITVQQEDRTSWPYCSTTTNFPVSISNNTPVTITGPTHVCTGFTATYSTVANPSFPYLWEVTGGNILSGFGTNSITVQWAEGPWGTVQATDLVCNNTDNLVVEITGANPALIDTANLTCDGSSLTLLVPGNYMQYTWSTGATSSSINITNAGNYSVSLTDAQGCTTEAAMTLGSMPTLPVPVASITGAGPLYTPIVFLELTAHPANERYQWSTGGTTERIYVTSAGTYNVTVTNEYGCIAAATVNVINEPGGGLSGGGGNCQGGGSPGAGICPLVLPDFTNSTCNPIQFTNTTSPVVLAYVWDFGDGAYAWTEHAAHAYTATGNYTVDLWATDNGVCWSLVQHTVSITSLLEAKFSFAQACFGQPVQFTDLSTSVLPVTSWQWNFGNGSISSVQNPSFVYGTPGSYPVELTISDGVCSDIFRDTVMMRNLVADFTYQQACFGMSTLFTDNSTGALQIIGWTWDFNDGSVSTFQHPAHRFTTPGNHTVTLVTEDIAGCTALKTVIVDVTQFTAGNITYTGPTTFCQGGSLTLNAPAGAGYTYSWSTGETTSSITATEGGAYYVVVTNVDGCKDTTNPVAVTVYPRPFAFITATGPLSFCEYSHYVQLIANPAGPGFTYQWKKDGVAVATTQTTTISSVSHSGNYTVIVTDNHGCKDTSEIAVVTIFPNPPYPNVTASGPTTFCEGDSVTLTAPAGYQYSWTNGAITQSTTVANSGYYSVTIKDANGCSSSGGENVRVIPIPDMRLVAYGCYDVCISDSNVIYGPPGMSSYHWSTGETTASILIDAAGTYNLTATNNYGCTNSSSNLYISTTNFLGIDLGHDTSFCQGGTVTFDAGTGFTSYTWQNGNNGRTFTANTSGIYFVDVTDTSGCRGGDTVALTVFPNPVVSLLGDTMRCDTLDVLLDAGSGFTTYLWNDSSSNQILSVSTSGNYSVTVTDAHNCSASDALHVSFSGVSSAFSLGSDRSFCGAATVTFDAGAGYATYAWQDGSGNQTFTTNIPGVYIVNVTNADGCAARDSVVLNIFPNPVVNLQDTVSCDTLNIILDAGNGFTSYLWNDSSSNQTLFVSASGSYSVTVVDANSCTATDAASVLVGVTSSLIHAGPDTSLCAGVTVQLSVTGGASYTWTPDPTLSNTGINNPTAAPTSSTTYYVWAVDSNGCAQTDSVHIDILPLLTAQGSADSVLCSGNSIHLTASGGTQFLWSPADGLSCTDCANPTANPAQTTTYNVEVSEPGYCNSDVVSVTVNVLPRPETGLDSVITISQGGQATFTPNGGMADYDWWSEGWSCRGCPAPTVSPSTTTLYTLQVTDSAGCSASKQVLVRVMEDCQGSFYIPTAFSPNDDGHNDEFRIIHPGDLNLIDFKVFNRWGEIVFETEDPSKGWDGIYKGVKQELAVFAYYAQMSCGQKVRTIIGNVTLVP